MNRNYIAQQTLKSFKCRFCGHFNGTIIQNNHLGLIIKCTCCGQTQTYENLSTKGLVVKSDKLDDCHKWCDENE
jgi:transcription elongation factor Elf1